MATLFIVRNSRIRATHEWQTAEGKIIDRQFPIGRVRLTPIYSHKQSGNLAIFRRSVAPRPAYAISPFAVLKFTYGAGIIWPTNTVNPTPQIAAPTRRGPMREAIHTARLAYAIATATPV
jgi:hypothetical protein